MVLPICILSCCLPTNPNIASNFFFFLTVPHDPQDLSFPTRDQVCAPVPPAVEAHSLNHWIAREVLSLFWKRVKSSPLKPYLTALPTLLLPPLNWPVLITMPHASRRVWRYLISGCIWFCGCLYVVPKSEHKIQMIKFPLCPYKHQDCIWDLNKWLINMLWM